MRCSRSQPEASVGSPEIEQSEIMQSKYILRIFASTKLKVTEERPLFVDRPNLIRGSEQIHGLSTDPDNRTFMRASVFSSRPCKDMCRGGGGGGGCDADDGGVGVVVQLFYNSSKSDV